MEIKKRQSGLTLSELQIAVAMRSLTMGITSLDGGNRLEKWLSEHYSDLEGGFGTYNVLYLNFGKNRLLAFKLVEFLKKEEIGSKIQWVQTKDEKWLLQIYWE